MPGCYQLSTVTLVSTALATGVPRALRHSAVRGTMPGMLGSYRERPAPGGLAGVAACVWRNEITTARELRCCPTAAWI
ncbi:MAG: hypothetical protein M3332_04970 [Actinomycetota bacterium]|nr:hypothetical protein [Actinomycetota bacterium]